MKKQTLITIISIVTVVVLLGVGFIIFNNSDNNTTLSISEKQWIENNKNKVTDIAVLNNIAILNNEGSGIFFDFLESLEHDTGLSFNKISYDYGKKYTSEYAFKVVKEVDNNDVVVYADNYVILSKKNIKYNKIVDITDITLGVLNDDLEDVNTYIGNDSLLFKTFKNNEELLNEIDKDEPSVDAVILPKLIFLSNTLKSKVYINYNITEMPENYVISLGSTDKLNDIIRKYYKKWYQEQYSDSYAKHFTNMYFSKNEVDDQSKAKFRSKRYVYGFVNNPPFDRSVDHNLLGTNSNIISTFSKLSNVEVSYKEYDSYSKLIDDFNANKIDFYFDSYTSTDYKMDIYKTVSPYDEQIVIVSPLDDETMINSINSLKNRKVIALGSTKISDYLDELGADVVECKSIEEVFKHKKDSTLIALDLLTFNYYSKEELKKYKIDYGFYLDSEYSYVIRDIKENEIFKNFLDFYLSFVKERVLINSGYHNAIRKNTNTALFKSILILGLILVVLIAIYVGLKNFKPKKKNSMKKEDKLRYVDMLTSLKNRNYLNDKIEIWDESEIYPQTIIIVDLNNVAYINDNYGHQEGDNVIKEAANILITGQMEKSDIIRTNGNEFLIYLIEYDEKQIVSYIRKLNKDFKELSYGFGAAIGYSMITDGIKTIDDAINEATLDMRGNKEELNN